MFKNVLVAIDDKTRGRDAVALTKNVAGPGSRITFAHIYPPVVSASNILDGSPADAEAARALLVAVAKESGIKAHIRCAASVSVSDGLHNIAERINADLLIIGGSTRNRVSRVLIGNLTADALATADCTVAVAPPGYADHPAPIHKVGVAYDGSTPSEAGLAVAQTLAQSLGAELLAFSVVPPYDGLVPHRRGLERAVLAMKASRDQIEAHDGVEARVACGDTVKQLAGFSNGVDILVAGARGAGFVARLLHPSTTQALADLVKCPLLVVTKGAREKELQDSPSVLAPARLDLLETDA